MVDALPWRRRPLRPTRVKDDPLAGCAMCDLILRRAELRLGIPAAGNSVAVVGEAPYAGTIECSRTIECGRPAPTAMPGPGTPRLG